jgi:bifunctional UDP-N-acetylglucosamine pyrophosphorylase / glucosamine-1-phosphate N-acetyltransferase
MFGPDDLFDLGQTEHAAIFDGCGYAWEALRKIKAYLALHLRPEFRGRSLGRVFLAEDVFVGEGSVIEEGAMIKGPTYIGKHCEVRHGAYIRGDAIIGDGVVVGNSTELKNALLFNGVQVPHFNYVGDSILGHRAHLGAGVKISNVKLDRSSVTVVVDGAPLDTGLRKFGALIGDFAEVGCNAVLNPGAILGRNSIVYANCNWRGALAQDGIAKNRAVIEVASRRARPR